MVESGQIRRTPRKPKGIQVVAAGAAHRGSPDAAPGAVREHGEDAGVAAVSWDRVARGRGGAALPQEARSGRSVGSRTRWRTWASVPVAGTTAESSGREHQRSGRGGRIASGERRVRGENDLQF